MTQAAWHVSPQIALLLHARGRSCSSLKACIADMATFLVANAKALGGAEEQELKVKESVLDRGI